MDTLILVVVPDGRAGTAGALRANIAVMPRLESPSLQVAGMKSWPPAALTAAQLKLDFAPAPREPAQPRDTILHSKAERGLWERYFPAGLAVRSGEDDGEDARVVVVQPSGRDGAAAEQIFRDAAAAPLGAANQRRAAFASVVSGSLARNAMSQPIVRPGTIRSAFPLAREAGPEFHDMLGLLREHPTVQKALGLILPVELAAPPADVPAIGVVRVVCEGMPDGLPEVVCPWTEYELSDGRFLLRSTEAIDAGMVPIGPATIGERLAAGAAGWQVLTVDADSAVGALRDLATRTRARVDDAEEPALPLPALRTGGIAIARVGLQADLDGRHQRLRAQRVANKDSVITADELLLGYRLDVQRQGEDWRSLSVRQATYTVDGIPLEIGAVSEEGHIKVGAALDHGDGRLLTDEIVARWTGWSVTVRRPSFTLDANDPEASVPGLGFKFETVPGLLPRLRFGASYQLRMRVADIGGGGLEIDDPLAERHITDVIPFGRYEPIASPHSASEDPKELLPGESDTEIVVRSDRGLSPAQFAAANPQYSAPSSRAITPPLTTLGMAEQHHMLDLISDEERWKIVSPVLTAADPKSRLALPDPAAGGVAAYIMGMQAPAISGWGEWPEQSPKRILAQAPPDPLQPVLSWRGDDLTVSLVQAATVTIELSSTIRERFDAQMAAQLFMGGDDAAEAKVGRHPLVTPAISIAVTHATRMPLNDPRGSFTILREAGETGATLSPTVVKLGIDPESTAKLEITADWSEPDDATTVSVSSRMIKTMTIDRGAEELPELLRHEFGDTRHRVVRYTVNAVSRFRHCFLETEPDELFAAVLQTDSISIPSTGTPPALKILRALPSFVWTSEDAARPAPIRHIRDCLIRVELARPWFATGEGEQLAVILTKAGAPSAALQDYVSEVGRDPLWQTGSPSRWLAAEQFTLAGGPVAEVTPPGTPEPVLAVPHPVFFDSNRNCWFCDIAIGGIVDASYAPLVRLALARFQPDSLAGYSISTVALTDFVPLLPRRELSINQSALGKIEATLVGIGPSGPSMNTVEYVLEGSDAGSNPAGPTVSDSADQELPGWRAISAPVSGGLGATATITFPDATQALRLRVSEYENLVRVAGEQDAGEIQRRVVFTDSVMIA